MAGQRTVGDQLGQQVGLKVRQEAQRLLLSLRIA
jgi:hypothetical protein